MPTPAVALARITVHTPVRRLDVALPAAAAVAELLPELVRHAGGDTGPEASHQEWQLRRMDGTLLSTARGLAVQGVRDGEVLHLVPATVDWPEPRYDDLPAALAAASARRGAAWSPAATTLAGQVAAALLLAGGLGLATRLDDPAVPAAAAAGLLAAAGAGRRAHRRVAALLVAFATAYAMLAGGLGGAHWLGTGTAGGFVAAGVAGLMASAIGGFVLAGRPADADPGALDGRWVVAAGATVGAVGLLVTPAALIGWGLTGAAAVLACLLVCGVGAAAPLALYLARLPAVPVDRHVGTPRAGGASDASGTAVVAGSAAVAGTPVVAGSAAGAVGHTVIFPAVARADELLTGMLVGAGVLAVGAAGTLVAAGETAAWVLAGLTGAGLLLRAGGYAAVRHRLPLLVAGGAVLAVCALSAGRSLADAGGLLPGSAAVIAAGAGALLAVAGDGRPGRPYLGRVAEIAEVAVVVAMVPAAAWAVLPGTALLASA